MTKINSSELLHWFNALRNLKDEERTRMLDSLWDGQLISKEWISDKLPEFVMGPQNIYIFGGWTGILANLLFQNENLIVNKIRSIDLDPWCEKVADDVNKLHEMNGWRFKARTADMATYDYEWGIHPSIVINTSTEHVKQDIYDQWYNNIPKGTLIIIQGNDFFDCSEHIRCTKTLEDFEIINKVTEPLFSGSIDTSMYTRFMCIWRKT